MPAQRMRYNACSYRNICRSAQVPKNVQPQYSDSTSLFNNAELLSVLGRHDPSLEMAGRDHRRRHHVAETSAKLANEYVRNMHLLLKEMDARRTSIPEPYMYDENRLVTDKRRRSGVQCREQAVLNDYDRCALSSLLLACLSFFFLTCAYVFQY